MGVRVYDSEANYLLLRSDKDLYGAMLEKGILIRDCSNYPGLEKGYYRVAVRLPEQNRRLLSAMKEVLK